MMAELSGGRPIGRHISGLRLVAGRVVHAVHLSFLPQRYTLPVVAIALTFTAYLITCGIALF